MCFSLFPSLKSKNGLIWNKGTQLTSLTWRVQNIWSTSRQEGLELTDSGQHALHSGQPGGPELGAGAKLTSFTVQELFRMHYTEKWKPRAWFRVWFSETRGVLASPWLSFPSCMLQIWDDRGQRKSKGKDCEQAGWNEVCFISLRTIRRGNQRLVLRLKGVWFWFIQLSRRPRHSGTSHEETQKRATDLEGIHKDIFIVLFI